MPCTPKNDHTPPQEWGTKLERHDQELGCIFLHRRRGGAHYQDFSLADFGADPNLWRVTDTAPYGLLWLRPEAVTPAARREQIQLLVEQLWTHAGEWTSLHGEWADFKLVGYDEAGSLLFQVGKRLSFVDMDVPEKESPVPAPPSGKHESTAQHRERERRLYERTQRLLERIEESHAKLIDNFHRIVQLTSTTAATVPELYERAAEQVRQNAIIREELIRRESEARDENIRLQEHIVTEENRTLRWGKMLDFLADMGKLFVSAATPFIHELAKVYFDPGGRLITDFEHAQQAMELPLSNRTVFSPGSRDGIPAETAF